MAHKFDVNNRSKLESEERRRLLAPSETLAKLGYKKGDDMADIGCGIGLFTLPAAEIGGEQSKIYAVDVSSEMLADVKKRAESAGLGNIIPVKSDEYDFKLADGAADLVFICAVLHEIDDRRRFLAEAARICRKNGKIAVIDFNETYTESGPPLSHRIARERVSELLAGAGFRSITVSDVSEAFYAVTGLKLIY